MERPNTVAGLIDKRRELAARLKVSEVEVKALTADLDALDTVIRMFAPEIEGRTHKEKRIPPPFAAKKGEFQRIAFDLLREQSPITSLMVAERFAANRNMPPDDRALTSLRNRASNALGHMKDKGLVRQLERDGAYKGWVLASTPTGEST